MAKSRSGTKKEPQNNEGVPHGTADHLAEKASENWDKARAVIDAKLQAEHAEPVILQVKDIEHARSEEVLKFCLAQLQGGTTYNALRIKLGLGPASHDPRWRAVRSTLTEMILPANEDEALMSANALSGYLLNRMEQFADRARQLSDDMVGDKNHFQYLKLELDAMKILTEKYEERTNHYLKMKDLQKQEKGRHGQTVVFNNKFYIPRPGEAIREVGPSLAEAAKLVARLDDLENE